MKFEVIYVPLFPSNRSSFNLPTAFLQLQPHRGQDITYCQFFDEGGSVLSCSSNEAKVVTYINRSFLWRFAQVTMQLSYFCMSSNELVVCLNFCSF